MSVLWYSTWAKMMPSLWKEMCKMQEEQPFLEALQEPQQEHPMRNTRGTEQREQYMTNIKTVTLQTEKLMQ